MAKAMEQKQWLERARELRAAMFEDEAAFYLFLVDGENGGVAWHGTVASFEELLDEFELCKVARYVSFRNALSVVDRAHASSVGVDGVIEIARVKSQDKRNAVIASLEENRARRGVPPTARLVRQTIQQIAPVARTTRDLARVMNRDKLEQENASLRKRVRELEREVAKLEAQLAKVSKTSKKKAA